MWTLNAYDVTLFFVRSIESDIRSIFQKGKKQLKSHGTGRGIFCPELYMNIFWLLWKNAKQEIMGSKLLSSCIRKFCTLTISQHISPFSFLAKRENRKLTCRSWNDGIKAIRFQKIFRHIVHNHTAQCPHCVQCRKEVGSHDCRSDLSVLSQLPFPMKRNSNASIRAGPSEPMGTYGNYFPTKF